MPTYEETRFLHPSNLVYAEMLAKSERINLSDDKEMFKAGLYIIMAIKENYKKQMSIYNELLSNGLDTPQTILDNHNLSIKISDKSMDKSSLVLRFANWWQTSDWQQTLLKDVNSGRSGWYNLRGELAETAPGLSYKSASLLMEMCGYDDVVVIDTWVMKYTLHKKLIAPSYSTRRGLSKKEYLRIEKIITKKAHEFSVAPAVFRRALWVNNSSWKSKKGSLDQLVLDLKC